MEDFSIFSKYQFKNHSQCGANSSKKYSTTVSIVCSDSNEDHPSFDFASEDECNYHFIWKRNEACIDTFETSCGLIPAGYNLSPLQRQPHGGAQGLYNRVQAQAALDAGITTVEGEKCHFPFSYHYADGRVEKIHTCTNVGHYDKYWCCLEEECTEVNSSSEKNSKIGTCPHGSYQVDNDWTVLMTSEQDQKDLEMYISICGDLNKKFESAKCEGNSPVCILDKDVAIAWNVTSTVINELQTGHLEYRIAGKVGKDQKDGIMNILLSCAPGGQSRSPELSSHNDDFTRVDILWRNHAACKISEINSENSCILKDGDSGIEFDLEHLKGEYKVGEYNLAMCLPDGLKSDCGSKKENSNVIVCSSDNVFIASTKPGL